MARLGHALVELQARRPLAVLLAGLLSALLATALASRLELRTGLGELLPEGKPSVRVAAEVADRLPTTSTLAVVAQSPDAKALRDFVDSLSPRLEAIGPPLVGRVEVGRGEAASFFARHRFLYASVAELEEAKRAVEERFAFELHRRAGMLLLDEEREDWAALIPSEGEGNSRSAPAARYLDAERGAAVVLVRTPIAPGDLEQTDALTRRVRAAVAATPAAANLEIGLSGDLLTAAETYRQVKDDLSHVGLWGVLLVLSVVVLYFRRLRALLAIALPVGIGTAWTFALAAAVIGHLNAASGFLFSIVVGNGINFGIILLSRLQAISPRGGLARAMADTWPATLTAAAAASAAYGSLAVTDFRGFRHFGLIGGSGMLACWIATYLFLPPLVTVLGAHRGARPTPFGRPFGWAVRALPRPLLAGGALLSLAATLLAADYLRDPMEHDLRRIDSRPELAASEARRLVPLVDAIVGRQGQDGVAIAVENRAQMAPLMEALERRRTASEPPPFERVVALSSLLPSEQARKLELLAAIRSVLERARAHGLLSAADDARLAELLPALEPLTIDDLPESLARPFSERDGTRGRLLYLVPTRGESVWDGRYLLRWAASFRRVELPDGSVIHGSGRSVIYADLLEAIREEAPKAIALSLGLTLLLVLVAFRTRRAAIGVAVSVVLGLSLTLGALRLLGSELSAEGLELAPLKLNFLSFVALPITVGVGADYAVNLMRRLEDGEAVAEVVRRTGGAVVLCSLTTTLGYGALTLSVNGAIRSFGLAAASGEIACLLVALLLLPAWWQRQPPAVTCR